MSATTCPTSTATAAPPLAPIVTLDVEGIPAELRERRQWVLWKFAERDKDGKPTKMPYKVSGRLAATNNSKTWNTFDAVVKQFNSGGYSGIGYVFSVDDPYTGIDLDDCRDAATGELAPWAQAFIDDLATYAEISPSGTGVKLVARGTLKHLLPAEPDKDGKLKTGRKVPYAGGAVEAYYWKRFFTITGRRLEGTPAAITEGQGAIDRLWGDAFAPVTDAAEPTATPTATDANEFGYTRKELRLINGDPSENRPSAPPPSDPEIIERAKTFKNGAKFSRLWSGDTSEYDDDDSRADQALCCLLAFYTWRDPARIDSLFRQSGLMREKWERAGYRQATISKAIEGCRETCYWPSSPYSANGAAGEHHANGAADKRPPVLSIWHVDSRTERANAKRLVALHGKTIRWVDPWQRWIVWDGRRWAVDDACLVDAKSKDVGDNLWREVQAEESTRRVAKQLLQTVRAFAKSSCSKAGIGNLAHLAKSEPGIAIDHELLDANPWLLNVENGTLNVKISKLRNHDPAEMLRTHDPADMLTKMAPVMFNPEAKCPAWDEFLKEVTNGDSSLSGYLRTLAGYCLTGCVTDHLLPFLWGAGSNGKSTFTNTLLAILGDEYAMKAAPELIMSKGNDTHPTERADLFGKRFVATNEIEKGRRLNEALVKDFTGADRIRARRMREDFWEFSPTHKIWLAGNHKPEIKGTDHGIWRRVKLIPFTVTIPDERQDKTLPERLLAEASGILNWMLAGCVDWQQSGLREPEAVHQATEAYRNEQDVVGQFLAECCVIGPGLKVRGKAAYTAFSEWMISTGERPFNANRFGESMAERFAKVTNNGVWYTGVGLRAAEAS